MWHIYICIELLFTICYIISIYNICIYIYVIVHHFVKTSTKPHVFHFSWRVSSRFTNRFTIAACKTSPKWRSPGSTWCAMRALWGHTLRYGDQNPKAPQQKSPGGMNILNFTSSWDFVIFREYWISRSRCNIWCSVREIWYMKNQNKWRIEPY